MVRAILSGGNFHGQPMAFAADFLAIALAELASISERRIEKLTNTAFSGLPPFLRARRGSELRVHDGPGDGGGAGGREQGVVPSRLGRFDSDVGGQGGSCLHGHGGRRSSCVRWSANVRRVLAIELVAAAQGIDLMRPLRSSERAGGGVRNGPCADRVPGRRPGDGRRPGARRRAPRRARPGARYARVTVRTRARGLHSRRSPRATEPRILESALAVAQRGAVEGFDTASGGRHDGMTRRDVPLHRAAEARVQVRGALGDPAELQRRSGAHELGDLQTARGTPRFPLRGGNGLQSRRVPRARACGMRCAAPHRRRARAMPFRSPAVQ